MNLTFVRSSEFRDSYHLLICLSVSWPGRLLQGIKYVDTTRVSPLFSFHPPSTSTLHLFQFYHNPPSRPGTPYATYSTMKTVLASRTIEIPEGGKSPIKWSMLPMLSVPVHVLIYCHTPSYPIVHNISSCHHAQLRSKLMPVSSL